MINTTEFIINLIIYISVGSLFVAILIDFIFYQNKQEVKKERHSLVTTGSMFGFFVIYYFILRIGIGKLTISPFEFQLALIILGTSMILVGAIINILGRLNLKENWANQIKIYKEHALITSGPYGHIRHPLYSSIILMLYGGALVYMNWVSILLVTFIFVPAMIYRAKQEEKLLAKEFEEYEEYRKQVGLFFPKNIRRY